MNIYSLDTCLCSVFSYFKPEEIAGFTAISHTFYQFATDDSLWKPWLRKVGIEPIEGKVHQQYLEFLKGYCSCMVCSTHPSHSHLRNRIFNSYGKPDCSEVFRNLYPAPETRVNVFLQKFAIDQALTRLGANYPDTQKDLDAALILAPRDRSLYLLEAGAVPCWYDIDQSLYGQDLFYAKFLVEEKGVKAGSRTIISACKGYFGSDALQFIYFLIDHSSEVLKEDALNAILEKQFGASLEYVQRLIERGTRPSEKSLSSCLKRAGESELFEIMDFLIKNGAKTSPEIFRVAVDKQAPQKVLEMIIETFKADQRRLEGECSAATVPQVIKWKQGDLQKERQNVKALLHQTLDKILWDLASELPPDYEQMVFDLLIREDLTSREWLDCILVSERGYALILLKKLVQHGLDVPEAGLLNAIAAKDPTESIPMIDTMIFASSIEKEMQKRLFQEALHVAVAFEKVPVIEHLIRECRKISDLGLLPGIEKLYCSPRISSAIRELVDSEFLNH